MPDKNNIPTPEEIDQHNRRVNAMALLYDKCEWITIDPSENARKARAQWYILQDLEEAYQIKFG
jgi:hypothetical protein